MVVNRMGSARLKGKAIFKNFIVYVSLNGENGVKVGMLTTIVVRIRMEMKDYYQQLTTLNMKTHLCQNIHSQAFAHRREKK